MSKSIRSAVILLKSKDLFLRLQLICLMLQGRRLIIKEGNASLNDIGGYMMKIHLFQSIKWISVGRSYY